MAIQDGRDWSKRTTRTPNTKDAVRWFRGEYHWLARSYPGYQVTHGEHAPYLTLEHYIQVCRAKPHLQKRAANHQHHREIRYSFKVGRLVERDDWAEVRDKLMWEALCFKFSLNSPDPDMRIRLLATFPDVLLFVDSNIGCENHWGSCTCPNCNNTGRNVYGKMLLAIRNHVVKGEL